jgi:hypothetical protein
MNAQSILSNRLLKILDEQIRPFPAPNLKLDLLITGNDIHRGHPPWNQPQIGWMKGDDIRRDSNV